MEADMNRGICSWSRVRHRQMVNRYNFALLVLALAVVPLFYVSGWLGVLAAIAIYCLVARLANNDLDRRSRHNRRLHSGILRPRGDSAGHGVRASKGLLASPP